MGKRIRLGAVAGILVMILNILGGLILGVFANCYTLFAVMIATGMVELQCTKRGYADRAVLSGGITGGMIGLFGLIGQILGYVGRNVAGSLYLFVMGDRLGYETTSQIKADATWLVFYIMAAVVAGIVNIVCGVVVGAAAAKPVPAD